MDSNENSRSCLRSLIVMTKKRKVSRQTIYGMMQTILWNDADDIWNDARLEQRNSLANYCRINVKNVPCSVWRLCRMLIVKQLISDKVMWSRTWYRCKENLIKQVKLHDGDENNRPVFCRILKSFKRLELPTETFWFVSNHWFLTLFISAVYKLRRYSFVKKTCFDSQSLVQTLLQIMKCKLFEIVVKNDRTSCIEYGLKPCHHIRKKIFWIVAENVQLRIELNPTSDCIE
jgi:hypothetical protein